MGNRDESDVDSDIEDACDQDAPPPPQATGPYPGWLDEHMLRPSAPLPPGAGIRVIPIAMEQFPGERVPGRWAADPTGRHQWRWWGGLDWTVHVADDGVVGEDPIEPS